MNHADLVSMLPAHIIEELRRREECARRSEQPRVHLPLPELKDDPEERTHRRPPCEENRGVWIVDLMG